MANNIEHLQTEVTNIKNSLSELKNNITLPENEKKTQAESLKAKAEAAKQKIESEIINLDNQTKTEAQNLLNKSMNEITELYTSIMNTPASPASAPVQPSAEDKNIFTKVKDWVWDQWDAVLDKWKWKRGPEWWKNLLRAAWFGITIVWWAALAWVLVYKWVKKLWNWAFSNDEEKWEETETKSKKKKKKPFWDRWYWKALKWGAITIWGVTLVNWLWEHFGWWWTDEKHPTDKESPEVKYKAFDKLDQQSKEMYNALWDQIDNTYEKMFDRELKAGYQDEMNMWRIAREVEWNLAYTWIIPFCLDNKFGSVEDLLWQNNSISEAMRWWVQKMVGWLKTQWNNVLETFASDYLSKLPSWTGMTFVATTLEWKVEEWAKKNANTQKELEYFFRQSIRVERYFFEKKRQLEYKLAEQAANLLGNGKTAQNILDDDSLYEQFIQNNPDYQTFLHSGLLASSNILKNEWMLDDNISSDTVKAVKELDEKRDEILGKNASDSKDVIQIINEKVDANENITQSEKTLLSNACTNMSKDIEENIIPALEDSPIAIWENLLWTSDDPNIKKYIEKGWIIGMISDFRTVLWEWKQKLERWELSPDKIKELAWKINDLLALKKEIILWAWTIWMEDENIVFKWVEWIYWSVCNLYKWVDKIVNWDILEWLAYIAVGIPGALVWIWSAEIILWWWMVITWNLKWWFKLMRKWARTGFSPLYLLYLWGKYWIKRSWLWRYSSSMARNLLLKSKRLQRLQFRWPDGVSKFKEFFHRWELTLSDASDILAHKVDSRDINISRKRLNEFNMDKNLIRSSLETDWLYIDKCLFDDYFLSKKWNNATSRALLNRLKWNTELYEKAIKWFDKDPTVKDFINTGWNDISSLENKLKNLEQAEEDIIRRWRVTPENFSPENEKLWNENPLKNEFDNERTSLEREKARKLDEIEKEQKKLDKPNATETQKQRCRERIEKAKREINKIEPKLGELDKFERELKITMNDMWNETAVKNLLWEYEQIIKQLKNYHWGGSSANSMSEVIAQVKCLEKLQTLERPNWWWKYFKDLDDVIKNLIPSSSMANDPKSIAHILSEHPELNVDASKFKRLANNLNDLRAARLAQNADRLADSWYAIKAFKKLVKVASKF